MATDKNTPSTADAKNRKASRAKTVTAFTFGSWFGLGFMPIASGTWGSLGALPFAWFIANCYGGFALIGASVAVFVLGIWCSDVISDNMARKDPGVIVIDEVAGQWLTLAFVPTLPVCYLAAFLFFRFADILKPWPAGWADKKINGGIGVMADDVLAAPYSAAATWLLIHFAPDLTGLPVVGPYLGF